MSTNIFKYIDINGIWNKIPKLLRMVIILLFIFIATYSLLSRYAHESNINTIKQIELTLSTINESLNNTAVFQDEQIKLNQQIQDNTKKIYALIGVKHVSVKKKLEYLVKSQIVLDLEILEKFKIIDENFEYLLKTYEIN